MRIFVRPGIETAREAAIRNRHFYPACKRLHSEISGPAISRRFAVKKPSFRTPKLRFQQTIAPIPRFSGSSVSLDYANHWRSQHTESACHNDRKSCSTRREISSPGRR
ncbi:hypothetical protein Taro_018153 [Colocasia esculenta]|uniref:Uncharacterized protein n=1 Tax=Colocasia esculenta TaxID=4460 RepID=A0A843UVF5_COLES|nr:hypothetical protein [Colocasia esculenta]